MYKKEKQYCNYLSNHMSWNHFIVKTSRYHEINPKNYVLDYRYFYIDMQILLSFILNNGNFAFMKKAYTHLLSRDDSESSNPVKLKKTDYLTFGKKLGYNGIYNFTYLYFEISSQNEIFHKEIKEKKYKNALITFKKNIELLEKNNLSKKMFGRGFVRTLAIFFYLKFHIWFFEK